MKRLISEVTGFCSFVCLTVITTMAVLVTSDMPLIGAVLLGVVVTSGALLLLKIILDTTIYLLSAFVEAYKRRHNIE
jgi:hypothetical protein